jgi:glycosyltransferase 2 family protein
VADQEVKPDLPPASQAQPGARVLAATQRVMAARALRWGFVAAAVAVGCYAVVSRWHGFHIAVDKIGLLAAVGALIAAVAAAFTTMQIWRALLDGLGSPLPVLAAARIVFLGQLGKYLPGSVWPVLAQMEMASAHKVPRHRSGAASVLTMLVALLTGLLTALVTLPFVGGSAPYLWAFAAAPVLLACLHPKVLNALVGKLLRVARRPPLEHPLTTRALLTALAWGFANWICFGLQIWLLIDRLGVPPGHGILLAVGSFAFAWSVGFIIVFAPAGAGAREVILVALLSPALGTTTATAVALVSRVLTTGSDMLTAALAAAFTSKKNDHGELGSYLTPKSP